MSVSGTTFGFPVFSSDFPDFSSGFLVFFYAHTFWKWLAEKTISENRQGNGTILILSGRSIPC